MSLPAHTHPGEPSTFHNADRQVDLSLQYYRQNYTEKYVVSEVAGEMSEDVCKRCLHVHLYVDLPRHRETSISSDHLLRPRSVKGENFASNSRKFATADTARRRGMKNQQADVVLNRPLGLKQRKELSDQFSPTTRKIFSGFFGALMVTWKGRERVEKALLIFVLLEPRSWIWRAWRCSCEHIKSLAKIGMTRTDKTKAVAWEKAVSLKKKNLSSLWDVSCCRRS